MRKLKQRDGVFGIGLIVIVVLWRSFSFADTAAYPDGILIVAVSVLTILAACSVAVARCQIVWRDVAHVPMALAGIGILMAVVLRQWWQFVPATVIDGGTDLPKMLMRYGVITVAVWVVGWCYLVVAVWPSADVHRWYAIHKHEIWGVAVVVVGASMLRWRDLGAIPNIINGDEGLIGMWAVQLLTQPGTLGHVFVNMDGVGTNYLLLMKGVIAVFGRTALAIRLIPALFGILAIITNYLFARTIFGWRVGMLTAVLLASAHVHVHFSRTVAVSYTYATALLPLLLWALWMRVHTRQTWPAIVAALTLSLHINMYVDAWAWSVLIVLILLAWALVNWQAGWAQRELLVQMCGLMLLGMAPMLIWGIYHPGDFFARLSTDGSFVSGWLAREAAARHVSAVQIIVELYQYAFSTYFTTPFEDFYHANVPILDWLSACFFVVGLAIVHNRLHTWRMVMVLGWFWGGMTALAVFTVPVSTYPYRLLVILPVVLLIVALGIDWLAARVASPRVAYIVIGGIVGVISLMNINIYHTQLATVCRYGGDLKTQQAGTLAQMLAQSAHDDDTVVVFGSAPDGFYFGPWRSLEYLNPTVRFYNIEDAPNVNEMVTQRTIWLVTTPERRTELAPYQVQYAQSVAVMPVQQCGQTVLYVLKIGSQ